MQYLKTLSRLERKKGAKEMQGVEVNELEEVEWRTEEKEELQFETEGSAMDPAQVRQGREVEINYVVKAMEMFEFGSWEDAVTRGGKVPTTTKWVNRVNKDDVGRDVVRCRSVARDFKPRREGCRDDLSAAMPPLETKKKELFSHTSRECVKEDDNKDRQL